MSVTKDSFRDWRANPVTKVVVSDFAERIERLKEELSASAGLDPLHDRFIVGAIGAYSDILNINFDEVNNGN